MTFEILTVNGIQISLLVIGIVQALKKLGATGKTLTLAAMLLGTTLAVGFQVSLLYYNFKVAYDIIVYGLGGGVAATGYYDLVNERIPKVPPEP